MEHKTNRLVFSPYRVKSVWWRWDISSLKAASLFLALLPHVLFVLLARSPAQVLLGTGCTNTQAHLAITNYK